MERGSNEEGQETMSDFYSERQVNKTRKDHKCFGCREKLPIGTTAFYIAGANEDGFGSYYLCIPCREYLGRNPMESGDFCLEGDLGDARRQEERDETP
jgi:hypothetical protein